MAKKIKPKFGRKAYRAMFLPNLSEEFYSSIKAILNLEGDSLDNYVNTLNFILDLYQMDKREALDLPKNTKERKELAANVIKKHIEALTIALYGDAGGLSPYLNRSVSLPLRGNGNTIHLPEFTLLLKGIKMGVIIT